ncbi:VOC family protein [Fodinicola acaciae]|uniref:VOC family protein n=1 Tax=Fodinicola acaciae TaxID=2681555 RepID=UPI0013D78B31|nr:VOC family protein [Fodinicola acaciae]
MTVRWLTAFLDSPPGAAAVDFWQEVTAYGLSGRRGERQEFATLLPPQGDAYLRVQDLLDGRTDCHLDLHYDDPCGEADRVVSLGATVTADLCPLVVMCSPGGLPFCLTPHASERERPLPARWPGGHQSVVDQLCVDVPPELFEAETRFWSAVTGWQLRDGVRPEFRYLERPPDLPLRLLFQRLESDDPIGAHLDLACSDRAAEVSRHRALGAMVVRMTDGWVTFRDPGGRVYCVTNRSVSR